MKSKSLIFILSILFVFKMNAQKSSEGYIIRNNGDSISGFINLKTDAQNGQKCLFKETEDGSLKSYSPLDIRAYHVPGSKYYVSRNVNLNGEEKPYFLEFLINGYSDLYYLRSDEQDFYFVEVNDTLISLTKSTQYLSGTANQTYAFDDERYKGILKIAYKESPQLWGQIENMSFSTNSMMKITEKFHNAVCDEYACVNYRKTFERQIFLELNGSYLSTSNEIKSDWKGIHTSSPRFGFNVLFQSLLNRKKIYFGTGLHYTSYKIDAEQGRYDIMAKYSAIVIPLYLHYDFSNKAIIPDLRIGLNNVIVPNPDHEVLYDYPDLNEVVSISKPESYRNYHFGVEVALIWDIPINDKLSVLINAGYEYRRPSIQGAKYFDDARMSSIIAGIGLKKRIK